MLKLLKKNWFYVGLVLMTPWFWWMVFHAGAVAKEFLKIPTYTSQRVSGVYTESNLKFVEDLRWVNLHVYQQPFRARFFYNKLTVMVNELLKVMDYISPRLYFQSGDGSNLSPPGVEPIPVIFFPFWLIGIFTLVKKKTFKPLLLSLLFAFIAFVIGRRTLSFLLPNLFLYVYIAGSGMKAVISKKKMKIWLSLFLIYSLYLLGRIIWIIN